LIISLVGYILPEGKEIKSLYHSPPPPHPITA